MTKQQLVTDAWSEYLRECRRALDDGELRYEEIEPWAWTRLKRRLSVISRVRERRVEAKVPA